ncbi:MAG: VWA domain-containing protein, partial [Bacteroidota bacterium]
SQELNDAFSAMEETGYLITQTDTNITGTAQNIYNKLDLLFPDYFDFNVSIKEFDLNSSECRANQTFEDCFGDFNEFTFGSAIPSDKSISYGKKILVKKQPPGECDTNVLALMDLFKIIPNKNNALFFDGEEDMNFVFDVNVTPSDAIECDQNILIELSAAFPPGYRRPVDIMLVIDKSGSMSWGGLYESNGPWGLDIDGDTVYLADYSDGIRAIDVSTPLDPQYLDRYDTYRAYDVFVDGSYAYLADYTYGIRSIDISDPNDLSEADRVDLSSNYSYGIIKSGNYVYAANGSRGVDSYDASNPNNINDLDRYNTPGTAYGLDVDGSYLYVADGGSGFRILNISNPNNMTNEDSMDLGGYAYRVKKSGNYAFLANGSRGLDIFDISVPSSIKSRGNYNTDGTAYGIDLVGNTAYIASGSGGVYAIDVTDVDAPSLIKQYETPYSDLYHDVRVQGNYAFIASRGSIDGLVVIELDPGTKMDAVHQSASEFIDFNEWKPSDQMGIATFESDSDLLSQLLKLGDANKTRLKNFVNIIDPLGGTNIESGIREATAELTSTRANDYAIKFQVLLSDGQSTSGSSAGAAFDAALEGIKIYTIGFGGDVDEAELQAIANMTDGNYYFASDSNALMDIYELIANEIQAQATDSNVTIVMPENITIINDGNAAIIDGNLVFDAGDISPGHPWNGSYIVNIPCDSNLSCDTSSIVFPGNGSFLSYVDINGNTQIVDWNSFTLPIPFEKRDLTVEITAGQILSETDIYLDVNVANIGDLNTGITDLNFYLGNDSICSEGAGRTLLSNHHIVPELCGGNNEDCLVSVVLYNEYFASQGIICAEVNPDGNIRECPNNNIDSIHCYLTPKTQFYVIEYRGWIK